VWVGPQTRRGRAASAPGVILDTPTVEAVADARAHSTSRRPIPKERPTGAAVVREAGPGLFYADLEVWRGLRRARRRAALVVVLVALAAAGTGAVTFGRMP